MKQPKSKVLIFGLLLMAACSEWGIAGNADTSGIGWVSLGMGVGEGIVLKCQVSLVQNNVQWSLRYAREYYSILSHEYVSDLGILGGFLARGQNGRASLSAGVAYVVGVRHDENRIGLAIAAEAVWTPSKSFGLGIELFGSVNTKRSFSGVVLSAHFGKMY